MARRRITSSTLQRSDALAQTFFVDAGNFPQGYFLSSLDLFFQSKDDVLPVMVEVRPVYNGFPSSSEVIPFSEVTLFPTLITVPSPATTIAQVEAAPTKVTFESPVHLVPGEYAIVVNCNVDTVRLFLAQHGEKILGGESVVKKQPYAGSFFKSQNGSTFTPDQKQDLMFRIRRCKFTTDTDYMAQFKSTDISGGDRIIARLANNAPVYAPLQKEFEMIRFTSNDLNFAGRTKLLYQFKGTPKSSNTLASSFTDITTNVDNILTATHLLNANGALTFRATFRTSDDRVSPIMDINPKPGGMVVENKMNNASLANNDIQITNAGSNYNAVPTIAISAPDISGGETAVAIAVVNTASSNSIEKIYISNKGSGYTTTPTLTITSGNTTSNVCTATVQGETDASGGNIIARYITRRANLDEEMEASNLRVIFDAFVHTTAGLSVYFKCKHRDDPTSFDDIDYQQLTQRNTTSTTAKVNQFNEYEYRSSDPIAYTGEDGSRYDKFTSFAVKICFYGSDNAYPPRVKNFRAIAVD